MAVMRQRGGYWVEKRVDCWAEKRADYWAEMKLKGYLKALQKWREPDLDYSMGLLMGEQTNLVQY